MSDNEKQEKPGNNYMRYSGLGFQIAGITALGIFIGYRLDKYLQTSKPYFTALFGIVFIFIALYLGMKDFMKK